MKKTVFRYFFDFTDKQEKWLNEMAARGLRLVHCGKITYTFEPCSPGEYQYCVEYAGNKSYSGQKDYKSFLEGLGYNVQCKNINLNWSVGKLRYRPMAGGAGKLSSSPGAFNRELLIVEKKNDGKPFELHTDIQDATVVFKTLRNIYLGVTVLSLVLASSFVMSMLTEFDFAWGALPEQYGCALFLIFSVIGGFHAVKYARISKRYKIIGETNE